MTEIKSIEVKKGQFDRVFHISMSISEECINSFKYNEQAIEILTDYFKAGLKKAFKNNIDTYSFDIKLEEAFKTYFNAPHFCQNGHPPIRHWRSTDPEEFDCPLCELIAKDKWFHIWELKEILSLFNTKDKTQKQPQPITEIKHKWTVITGGVPYLFSSPPTKEEVERQCEEYKVPGAAIKYEVFYDGNWRFASMEAVKFPSGYFPLLEEWSDETINNVFSKTI